MNYLEKANMWKSFKGLDKNLRNELESLDDNG